jgi:hypothetical protein
MTEREREREMSYALKEAEGHGMPSSNSYEVLHSLRAHALVA